MHLSRDKGVGRAVFMNWFLNLPIHSLIFSSFTLLKGLIATEMFLMQELIGVFD